MSSNIYPLKLFNSAISDWSYNLLENVSHNIDAGQTAPQGEEYFENGVFPFIRMKHINSKSKYVEKYDLINEKAIVDYRLKKYLKKSILLPKSGESIKLENRKMLDNDSYVVNHLCIIEPNENIIISDYLYYFLSIIKLSGLLTQTTTPSINLSDIKKIQVSVPPLVEQRGIAEVLGTVDEAIRRTDAIIEKAEELKRGLMQRLLTRGIVHTEFKQTELGEIPSIWEKKPLEKCIIEPITNGVSPIQPNEETGIWNLSLSALSLSGFKDNERKIAPIDIDLKKYRLREGDILVSRSNTRPLVGLAAMYNGNPEICIYPDLMMRIRVNPAILNPYFLELWLQHPLIRHFFMSSARGTSGSMVKINQTILGSVVIPIPSLEEQNKITEKIHSVTEKIKTEKNIKKKIEEAKKGLMQVLLSGRVRVRLDEGGLHRIRDS